MNETIERLCGKFSTDKRKPSEWQLLESAVHMQEQLDFLCWVASMSIDPSQISECRQCGHFIRKGDKYCGNCGTAIEGGNNEN